VSQSPERWMETLKGLRESLAEVVDYRQEYERFGVKVVGETREDGWVAVRSGLGGEEGYLERINLRDGRYERYLEGQIERELTFLTFVMLKKREADRKVVLDEVIIELAQRYGLNVPVGVEEPPKLSVIPASDIVCTPVEFLWPGRIPLGMITTLAGPGGVGKTFLLCDMAARISSGLEWPDRQGECAPLGQVLFVSGEDDPGKTLVPRMREQGADLHKIWFLTAEEMLKFNLAGPVFKACADREVADMGGSCSLIIIDPPSSFLAGIDENSNAEVRGILTPMKEWAEHNNCSIIFNTHVNKGKGKKVDVQERVMSSVAWVNGPRSSHMVTEDPDSPDVKLFMPLKYNIEKKPKGLSFRIVPTETFAKLEWLGEVDIDADTAVNGHDDNYKENGESRQGKVENWLIGRFKEKQEWTTTELMDRLREDLNMEMNATFDRAKKEVQIKSRKVGRTWELYVPHDWVYSYLL
jgi:AAA domain